MYGAGLAIYEGDWKDGKQHGHGTHTVSELNQKFVGEFENGKKHGYGEQTYQNGLIQKGTWKEDKKHGKCVSYETNGTIFECQYENGKENGSGKLTK